MNFSYARLADCLRKLVLNDRSQREYLDGQESSEPDRMIVPFIGTTLPVNYEDARRVRREYSIRELLKSEVAQRELQQMNIASNLSFQPNALIPGNESFQFAAAFVADYGTWAPRDKHELLIKQLPIIPSLVLSAGSYLQVIWLASSPITSNVWQNYQRGIGEHLGMSAQLDPAFEMWVPDSNFIRSDGHRYVYETVSLEVFLPDVRYSVEEMEQAFGSMTVYEEARSK